MVIIRKQVGEKLIFHDRRQVRWQLGISLVVGVAGVRAGVTTASPTRRWSSRSAASRCAASAARSSGSRTSASARLPPCSADRHPAVRPTARTTEFKVKRSKGQSSIGRKGHRDTELSRNQEVKRQQSIVELKSTVER